MNRRSTAWVFGTAGIVIVLDRLTKAWAERTLADGPVDVIDGVLSFRLTTNSGGAFGLGQQTPWFFAAAAIGMIAWIVITARRPRPVWASIGLGLVLGGAVGNLVDRATRGDGLSGRVVDFIDVHVWPIFNIADVAVVCGAVVLAISAWRTEQPEEPEDAA